MRGDEADPPPYSQRPDWKDVTPVPQDDGPDPLVMIRYPPGFEEAHSYFRAIMLRDEYSDRALVLTSDVIEHNSANYTAWYYRRRCLKELSSDLAAELEFTDKWARDCPKNYQVWYHRRWVITELAEQLRSQAGTEGAEAAEAKVRELGERELECHLDVMHVNDDYKNYNGWSHRQFIVQKFGLWGNELQFVENLILDDVRNNSAWNHRHTVVRNTCWPLTDETRQREIGYTLKALRSCANNESAWNYLAAFLGEGEGKIPWNTLPEVETFCQEVISLSAEQGSTCRFAVEAMAQVHEARGDIEAALQQYTLLKDIDKIRASYWDWREAALKHKHQK